MKRDIFFLIAAIAVIFGLRSTHVISHLAGHDANNPAYIFIWPELMQTKIHTDYVHSTYTAEFPDNVKAMVGKEVTIGGYMVPLEINAKASHFIMSRRTPTCPFCPPGEPNEVIQVETATPMAWTEDRVVMSGTFELINDTQAGLFFKLGNAKQVAP